MTPPANSSNPCIAVLGIGQMGSAAAVCFSRAGFPVLLWGRSAERRAAVASTLDRMNSFLDEHVGPVEEPSAVEFVADFNAIQARADVVLECISEDLSQKAELLGRLAQAVERGAVLASCTSGLSITEMGRQSGVGRRLVGAHFWNPPHLMPVVEVVRGDQTEDGLVEYLVALFKRCGKIPVVCQDVPGFIGNRLMHALWREALHLVQQGVCSAEDVDRVARLTFGLRLPAVGPFQNMDLVGLELVAQIHGYLFRDLCNATKPLPVVTEHLAAGRTGMRSGEGFYRWSQEDTQRLIDRRDRQILQQLEFLRRVGALEG
jgi:3-hydroxybutyryl-CoA dehydrogenase